MRPTLARSLVLLGATTALFALTVAWMGYDFAHLGDRLMAPNGNDPRHSDWMIEQTAQNMLTRLNDLGYAGVFYDDPNALGYSSANYGFALMGLPIYLISGHNPTLTYNFLQYTGVLLTTFSAYLLITYLLKPRFSVALLATFMIAFAADRVGRMGQIENTYYFNLLFMFYFTHRLIDQPRLLWALLLALAIAAAVLLNGYGLVIGGIGVLIIVLYALVVKRAFSPKLIACFALAGILGIAVTYPFINFRFERQALAGQSRQAQITHSAQLNTWFDGQTWLYQSQPTVSGKIPLFIGVMPLGLALLAFIWRKRGGALPEQRIFTRRDVVNVYAIMIVAGYALSLGPVIRLNGQELFDSPYQLLSRLPGFSAIRAIYRYLWLPVIATGVLSAFALEVLLNRMSVRAGRILLAGAAALLALELIPFRDDPPYNYSALDAYVTPHSPYSMGNANTVPDLPVYAWLRSLPANTPVMHYPIHIYANGLHIGGYKWHHQPMLNGYASYFPRWYQEMNWGDFPTPSQQVFLNQRGIRYVLIYNNMLDSPESERVHEAMDRLGFPYMHTFADVDVYAVPPVPRPQPDARGVVREEFNVPVFYGGGWSDRQGSNGSNTYQWTGSPSAALELPVAFAGDGTLSFRTLAAISPDVLNSLRVYVNDQPLVLRNVDGIFTAAVPEAVLAAGGEQAVVRFETDAVLPASTLYANGGSHLIGIAFDWVELAPAALAEALP